MKAILIWNGILRFIIQQFPVIIVAAAINLYGVRKIFIYSSLVKLSKIKWPKCVFNFGFITAYSFWSINFGNISNYTKVWSTKKARQQRIQIIVWASLRRLKDTRLDSHPMEPLNPASLDSNYLHPYQSERLQRFPAHFPPAPLRVLSIPDHPRASL